MNYLYNKCNYRQNLQNNLDYINSFKEYYILHEQISITKAEIFSDKCSMSILSNDIPVKWKIILYNFNKNNISNLSLEDKQSYLYKKYMKYIKVDIEDSDEEF